MGLSLNPISGLKNLADFGEYVGESIGGAVEPVFERQTYDDLFRVATGSPTKTKETDYQRLDDTNRRIGEMAEYRRRVNTARAIRMEQMAGQGSALASMGVGGTAPGTTGTPSSGKLQGSKLFPAGTLFANRSLY